MRLLRVLVPGLSALLASWVFLSFAGLMINPAGAGLWTTSLMWSLLASLFVMPVLVVVHHARRAAEQNARRREEEASGPSTAAAPPFVSRPAPRADAAWPPSETDLRNRK